MEFTTDLEAAVMGKDVLVLAVPSLCIISVTETIRNAGGQRNHTLERRSQLDAGHVRADINTENLVHENVLQIFRVKEGQIIVNVAKGIEETTLWLTPSPSFPLR